MQIAACQKLMCFMLSFKSFYVFIFVDEAAVPAHIESAIKQAFNKIVLCFRNVDRHASPTRKPSTIKFNLAFKRQRIQVTFDNILQLRMTRRPAISIVRFQNSAQPAAGPAEIVPTVSAAN